MNAVSFGEKIAKLRRKSRLTQKELAEKLNISDKAVSKWENGGGYPEITMVAGFGGDFRCFDRLSF